MSQNVTNNWFQKLGTDSNFLDKQTTGKSVATTGSTFQSFLSQQIKKSTPSSTDVKADTNVTGAKESKTLKRMDTTASKLSIKTPDRATVNAENEKSENVADRGNKVQKMDGSDDKTSTKVEKKEAVEPVETIKEDEETVDLSKVAPELLQMIQTLPEEVIAQLPEELQSLLAELSQNLQGISKLAEGKSEVGNDLKVNANLTIDGNDSNGNKNLVKTELVETLKQVIDQLKSSETVSKEQVQSFEKVLEQLNPQGTKPVGVNEGSQESKVSQPVAETTTSSSTVATNNNTSGGNGETKSELNNTANQNLMSDGKVSKETKIEVESDAKINTETTVHNFSAKAEASTIAFGKQEVTTQTVKTALHTNIMDQIINSPKLQIKQTEQGAMMTLKLNPEVLGNVEIKMEIVKGVLQAEINVENMIVKGAIESSLADLKNALSDKGYQVETLNVSVGQEGRQSQQQQQQERHNNEKAAVFTPEELEAINSSYDFDTAVNDTRINYLG